MKKTVAVDLDGTLVKYAGREWLDYEPDKFGEPIRTMVNRVKVWLKNGVEVVIFTARVHPFHSKEEAETAREAIKKLTKELFGVELEVTHEKHPRFSEIWDDKSVRVNMGIGTISNGSEVEDPLTTEEFDSIGSFLT